MFPPPIPAADAIDCIAYYGITQGTGDSTYSPRNGVTREHMALFLTRLAGLIGVEMAADPGNPGFTDIGDLSETSQTAIAQLADIEVAYGTTDTTFSPADMVERGHMALFISRLMNLMDPMAEVDGDEDTVFGYTPSDVEDVDDGDDTDDKDTAKIVESPFTDLGSVPRRPPMTLSPICMSWVLLRVSPTRPITPDLRSPVLRWPSSWLLCWITPTLARPG